MFTEGVEPGEGAEAFPSYADERFLHEDEVYSRPPEAAEWYAREAPVPDFLDEIVDTGSMLAIYAAERYRRVAAFHHDAVTEAEPFRGAVMEIVERSVRLELAMAMRTTESAAQQLIHEADALDGRYPTVLASLSRAATTEKHAQLFVELVDPVEAELLDQVVPQGVVLAETLPVGPFRRALRKLVETVRAATLEQRHREAVTRRRVALEPADDGMAWLSVLQPAVEARAAYDRLTAMAKTFRQQECETRTLDQLRADIVGDLLLEGVVPEHPKEARGIRATVAVTVPALALLDDDVAERSEPATVEGVGPIPIRRARELCGGASGWMRVLTHPETGVVLSVGRKKYRPPPELKRFVKWRAGRCLGPGCGMPAERCEIDHQSAWADGGRTEAINLCPFCKGHHTIKHHGGWRVRQIAETGAIEWTSPMGRVYLVHPERTIPVFTPDPEFVYGIPKPAEHVPF